MATDNSPPRIRLIFTVAGCTVAILVLLNPIFRSYFQHYVDETVAMRIAEHPPTEFKAARELWLKDLTASPVPIDTAMRQLATRARENSLISPEPSDDTAPLVGWSKLPHVVAGGPHLGAPGSAPAQGDGGAAAPTGDAGAAPLSAGDAGAPVANAADAGVRTATPDAAAATKTNAPSSNDRAPDQKAPAGRKD